MWQLKRLRPLAAVVAFALLLTACGGGKGGGTTPPGNNTGPGVKGGTLKILDNGDIDYLDTADAYYTVTYALMRLYARTLYAWDTTKTGDALNEPVPDLSDGPAQVSADGLTYTFKIRSGIKWSPPVNRAVTAQDFITAVERMYDSVTPSGGQSYSNLIKGAADFGSGKAKIISGMQAVGDNTLKITLLKPAGDFLSIVALPFFAPVPKEYASRYKVGPDYTKHVAATGPYMLKSYIPNKTTLFVRNPNWNAASDPLRKAWVDQVSVSVGASSEAIQQQIESGDADLTLDEQPPVSQLQRLATDPTLKKQFSDDLTGCMRFISMNVNPAAGAISKLQVRQAMNYAIDKIALQRARGGPFAGDPASTILTPTLVGFQKYDLYPTPDNKGDPVKAKALLAQAGYPNGLTLGFANGTSGVAPAVTTAIQTALARVNVKLSIKTYSGASIYTDQLGLPAKRLEHQLGVGGWCPDYPGDGARSFFGPLLYGPSILQSGNNNWAEYNNPKVNSMIDQALTERDKAKRGLLWGQIDRTVMQDAPWVPFLYDKQPSFWSARVHHWTFSTWCTGPDLAALWLKK